jgi:hypothetical protein
MPNDEKKPILPLVGRLIKERLKEFGQEARSDLREGCEAFRSELQAELDATAAEKPATESSERAAERSANGETEPRASRGSAKPTTH